MGDSHVGLQARLMSQALRKLAGTLNRTGTVALFTNQLREKIGVMFGSPETTPGGRALKFYSSVRLDMRRIETLKEGVEAIGNRVRVKVVKNKVAPPFKQAEFDVIYGEGISWEGSVLDVGLERKLVQKSGSYFSFGDERLGQGRQNATAFLESTRTLPKASSAPSRQSSARTPSPPRASSRGRGGEGRGATTPTATPRSRPKPRRPFRRPRLRTWGRGPRRSPPSGARDAGGSSWRSTGAVGAVVPDEVVLRCGLAPGVELDRPRLRMLRRELRRAEALGARRADGRAPRRLDPAPPRTPRGTWLRADAAEGAVARLTASGVVDDARTAASRASSLAERGWGDAAVAVRLPGEGFGAADARAALAELRPERERADRRSPTQPEDARAAWKLLSRRGFSAESAEDVVGVLDADR